MASSVIDEDEVVSCSRIIPVFDMLTSRLGNLEHPQR
jgi:hypothetical protein